MFIKPSRIVAHMAIRKQTTRGVCFMDERQPNSQKQEDCSR